MKTYTCPAALEKLDEARQQRQLGSTARTSKQAAYHQGLAAKAEKDAHQLEKAYVFARMYSGR